MKKLEVNGKIIAHYSIQGSHFFIKNISPLDDDCIIALIQVVEEKVCTYASYLNC